MVDLFLNCQVFQFFVEMLSVGFCLVNSECDACMPVDHSSVYSHPKMCVFFSRLILLSRAWFKTKFLRFYLFLLLFALGSS